MVKDDVRPSDVLTSELLRSAGGRSVHPKTAGQKRYTDAIAEERRDDRDRSGGYREVLPARSHSPCSRFSPTRWTGSS